MKRPTDWSIRKKLFGVILVILTVNFLLLVFLGGTLFQSFYEGNKIRELRKTAEQIKTIYGQNTDQSWENFYQSIANVENRNSEVIIFQMPGETEEVEILYHSRMRTLTAVQVIPSHKSGEPQAPESEEAQESQTPNPSVTIELLPAQRLDPPFMPIYNPKLLEQVSTMGRDEVLIQAPQDDAQDRDSSRGSRITLVTPLDETRYLMMDTPRDFIKSTADLAVRYSAWISIAVLFLGAVVLYFLSGYFTRPIREIDTVAQQIARLDFSASCPVHSRDEIGALAHSINHMSDKLQQSMKQLVDANQILQEDLSRQQETDRMRRQFISDVSHDFKTPLTLMISYAEAIRDGGQPEHTAEFCDIIADEGNRLSRMVGRLLSLSRLESGMDEAQPSVWSLNQLLEDGVRAQQLPARQKNLTILRHYWGETVVNADYQKLEQVVTNLVENAVKYTPEGGTVAIATALTGDGLCQVSIANTGSNIAEADLENIFVSFYRADQSRRSIGQSYGLGLAIVQTILALHGQQCIAENTQDGVRFRFSLPVVELSEE